MATDPAVQAWITKHSSDIYETDLWFVVKEGGKEIRVPACRAVLKLTYARCYWQVGRKIFIRRSLVAGRLLESL